MSPDVLAAGDIGRLLPMHLTLDSSGRITGCGPTMRKLIGTAGRLEEVFALQHPPAGEDGAGPALAEAARRGERVFLRLNAPPHTVLRGHGIRSGAGQVLLDLGFGIGLVEAVRQFNLTDADFSAADLAMEFLFLHEANTAVLGALSDYTSQLDEERQAAEDRAYTDPLTGLTNRRGLAVALEAAMRSAQGSEGRGPPGRRASDRSGFALLHLDLDGFKAVNDTHGHAAGDRVLQEVGAILREETRIGDAIARPGGDEFVLVLPGMVRLHALDALARRIIGRIEAPIDIPGGMVRISASIGIAVSRDYVTRPLMAMTEDADEALYTAKRSGRGRAALWVAEGAQPLVLRGPRRAEAAAPESVTARD